MSLKRYAHLCGFALAQPWALHPDMQAIVVAILADRMAGVDTDPAAVQAALAVRKNDAPQPVRGGVALLPMYGVLGPRMNFLSESSGGTSFERMGKLVREAGARSDVSTIVIDCDSPGGSCAGAREFAATLREVRAVKPIVFQVNWQATSAAYWVGSNATKIHVTPSGQVGSIGVFSIHNDLTEALAKLGVKRTYISAGKYKLEGIDGPPLTDDAHAQREQQCARMYDWFVADVAKGRGVSSASVRAGFGEGRPVDADTALELGMVDKIATLDETLDRLLPAGMSATAIESAAQTPDDTSQAAAGGRDQDRLAAVQWQRRMDAQLLGMGL